MRTLKHTILIMASAAMLWLEAACADKTDIPVPEPLPTTTNLVLDLRVNGTPASRAASAADRLPAGDWELIHTLRIIILAADGHVEHNGRYDLTAPAVQHTITIAVPNAEAKKIIFIANEDHFTVVDPLSGKSVSAAQYFNSLYATITPTEGNTLTGVKWTALQNIAMRTADNPVFSTDQLLHDRIPLPASAIYENVVIPRQPTYSRTFYLHRAAAKYTYRLTNDKSSASVVVNSASINYVANEQYLFPHVSWDDETQASFSDYTPLSNIGSQTVFETNIGIDDGETREFAIYLPEGTKTMEQENTGTDKKPIWQDIPYRTGLIINSDTDKFKMHDIEVGSDDDLTPGTFAAMKSLPRNTNVIINGDISFRATAATLTMNYTVCEWWNYETDIPPYN